MLPRRTLPAALLATALATGCAGPVSDTAATSATTTSTTTATPAADGEYTPIPGTKVLLRVPEGMQPDSAVSGVGRPGTRSTVVVTSLPVAGKEPRVALAEIATGFSGAAATRQGMDLGEVRELEVAGLPAVATSGTQRAGGTTYRKVMVVLAAEDGLVMLSGTLEPDDPLSTDDLLQALLATRWAAETAAGDLGFDLTPAPGYERQSGTNSTIMLTLGGESGPDVPKFLATPSLGESPVEAGRHDAFARERFEELPHSPEVESAADVEIAGLPGVELTGHNSRGAVVYAVLLFTETGYLVMVGDFDPDLHADQLPAFREMARSLVLQ